jgi:hypothetical protein
MSGHDVIIDHDRSFTIRNHPLLLSEDVKQTTCPELREDGGLPLSV